MKNPFANDEQAAQQKAFFDTIDSKPLQLLAEIGFVATLCGLWHHEADIFNAIAQVRPGSEYPWMSYAIARMAVFDFEKAVQLLKEGALKTNPNNALAQSFLALALKNSGQSGQSQQWVEKILAENHDPRAVEIAHTILAEIAQ